jgi:predicted nucleotidyltransferase
MSLIDNVMKDVSLTDVVENKDTNVDMYENAPLSTLSDEQTEEMLQVKLNNANVKRLELEKLLNMANADIERLEKENTHLAFVIREMKIKPSGTKFKALMDKVVDTAKKYKLQSPIIRK